jgi:hypothetical protein
MFLAPRLPFEGSANLSMRMNDLDQGGQGAGAVIGRLPGPGFRLYPHGNDYQGDRCQG